MVHTTCIRRGDDDTLLNTNERDGKVLTLVYSMIKKKGIGSIVNTQDRSTMIRFGDKPDIYTIINKWGDTEVDTQ